MAVIAKALQTDQRNGLTARQSAPEERLNQLGCLKEYNLAGERVNPSSPNGKRGDSRKEKTALNFLPKEWKHEPLHAGRWKH